MRMLRVAEQLKKSALNTPRFPGMPLFGPQHGPSTFCPLPILLVVFLTCY